MAPIERPHGDLEVAPGAEGKLRRLAAAEREAALERAFEAYGRRINSVQEFRYLGRVLTATDDDWPAVARNLSRARATWGADGEDTGKGGGGP